MANETKDINGVMEDFINLQGYADSQFHVISDLQKKVAELEIENRSLKSMLGSMTPDLELGGTISNEQLICETQLVLLKDAAITRSLTMEESKKFQIFSTVLESLRHQHKGSDWNVKRLSEDELIRLAVDNTNGTS